MRDEALKLALEALSSIDIYLSDTLSGRVNPEPATHKQWLIDGIIEARNRSRAAITAITAIKQALAALAQAAERNKLAAWMIAQGYATGHGDTTEDLLEELRWQVRESEREACAKVCEGHDELKYAIQEIRARGKNEV